MLWLRWALLWGIIPVSFLPEAWGDPGTDFFESRIRPLLIEHCVECHGAEKQKGGLRLDSREAWERGGEGGKVIIRGEPERSRLIAAVRRSDPDTAMPPKKALTAQQVTDLERWVTAGAVDPRKAVTGKPLALRASEARGVWPYVPLKPLGRDGKGAVSVVDGLVDEGLARHGLKEMPSADWRTLARRVSYGLTGLPPDPQEVKALVDEDSIDAYSAFVERLLASPSYGEHMARRWMDLARFSDTKGYVYAREEKRYVHAAAYRRWLIDSFNGDMPYDRFVRLQLAADHHCGAGDPDLAAMGFLTLGRRFLGVTPDIIDDRIDVVSRTLLGMTVACARCHDHKFDPVSTKDYYSLYAIFRSSSEALEPLSAGEEVAAADVRTEIESKREALRVLMAKRRDEQMGRVRASIDRHLMAQRELERYPDELFGQLLDGSDLNPFFVRAWEHFLADPAPEKRRLSVIWNAYAGLDEGTFTREAPKVHERLMGLGERDLSPVLREGFKRPPDSLSEVATVYQEVFNAVERRWREALKEKPDMKGYPDAEVDALRRLLHDPAGPCGIVDEHIANIENAFTNAAVTELWKAQGDLDRAVLKAGMGDRYATVLRDRVRPHAGWVFKRGNPTQRGDPVARRLPEIFGGEAIAEGSGRRALADNIASEDNPLTARVMANRVWAHHLGNGIVRSTSDFGVQGGDPSHPELLDHLASEFIKGGWSVKGLHRLIVHSQAYRRVSSDTGEIYRAGRDADPDNRWLWRGPTRRLGFEEIRDSWLVMAGQVTGAGSGGDPVSASNLRRSVYSYVDRDRLPAALGVWDFANPDIPVPNRLETTVPLQGLFGLNHPMVLARARALERRVEREARGVFVAKVRALYRHLHQREMREEEWDATMSFLNGCVETSAGPGSAGRFEQMIQMMMLSNEFLFVE